MSDRIKRARAFLTSDSASALARQIVESEPWLCAELGVDFCEWADSTLRRAGRPTASRLFILGSAALGFSLSPTTVGRPFRKYEDSDRPSDLDLAIVDSSLFIMSWESMVQNEVLQGPRYLRDEDKIRIYWGRIDDHRIPMRSEPRTAARRVVDAARRSKQFRGYPASLRVYRRKDDLLHYYAHNIRFLRRAVTE